ncbi:MAG: adenylyl-sulfate kinase [Candidatus Nanohaloarchaea archaeon]|nr:adenylyl-sulfate kinase [Candidatus Nanohaloarchaea archaeon]
MSFTLWFTGLPSSGKSTVAKRVEEEIRSRGLDVHNLDGDDLRKKLHPDLGFSKEERFVNNKRIAFISRLLNENNVGSIVAAVSPFKKARQYARDEIEQDGEFVEIFVDCPVEVCKERDPKGLYEKAEKGHIDKFTGVNHPFEDPEDPEIVVDTAEKSIDQCVDHVIDRLEEIGLLESKDEYTGLGDRDKKEIKDRLENLGYLG